MQVTLLARSYDRMSVTATPQCISHRVSEYARHTVRILVLDEMKSYQLILVLRYISISTILVQDHVNDFTRDMLSPYKWWCYFTTQWSCQPEARKL